MSGGAPTGGKRLGASNLSRPLPFGKCISVSSFAFLFAELVSYYRGRVSALSDLEARYAALSVVALRYTQA